MEKKYGIANERIAKHEIIMSERYQRNVPDELPKEESKYSDYQTGAHFNFKDVCLRLNQLKKSAEYIGMWKQVEPYEKRIMSEESAQNKVDTNIFKPIPLICTEKGEFSFKTQQIHHNLNKGTNLGTFLSPEANQERSKKGNKETVPFRYSSYSPRKDCEQSPQSIKWNNIDTCKKQVKPYSKAKFHISSIKRFINPINIQQKKKIYGEKVEPLRIKSIGQKRLTFNQKTPSTGTCITEETHNSNDEKCCSTLSIYSCPKKVKKNTGKFSPFNKLKNKIQFSNNNNQIQLNPGLYRVFQDHRQRQSIPYNNQIEAQAFPKGCEKISKRFAKLGRVKSLEQEKIFDLLRLQVYGKY